MRFRRRRPDPEPPVNVQMALADGSEIPVDCRYLGLDKDGIHIWEVIASRPLPVRALTVERLPARTAVQFSAEFMS